MSPSLKASDKDENEDEMGSMGEQTSSEYESESNSEEKKDDFSNNVLPSSSSMLIKDKRKPLIPI